MSELNQACQILERCRQRNRSTALTKTLLRSADVELEEIQIREYFNSPDTLSREKWLSFLLESDIQEERRKNETRKRLKKLSKKALYQKVIEHGIKKASQLNKPELIELLIEKDS